MRWLVSVATFLALLAAGTAEAQYPDKPVRIIVPFIAGSAPDVVARQVAQRLTASLGQQFVVENKPGAAGNIGAEGSTMTPADVNRFVQAEIDKWVPVVKASGAKPE